VAMALVLAASLGAAILPASPAQAAATTPMVSAGSYHTVGLKSDGSVVAVGRNTEGQCEVTGWTGITQVSAGYKHTVGLKPDGTVVAVGDNGFGQCNVGSWNASVTTEAATGLGLGSATLNMSYNVGLYVPVGVRFAYKKSADPDWTETSWVLKSASGTHAEPLSGLDPDAQYDFKAQLKYDSTMSTTIGGDILHFTPKTPPTVTTEAATGITTDSATLNMSYTIGDYSSVDVRFSYKRNANVVWTETSWVTHPGSPYSEPLTGLDSDTLYDFKAELRYDTPAIEIQGSTLQFTTDKIPPTVTTEAATDITTSSAILNGNLDDLGTAASCNVSFEWGTASGSYPDETAPETVNATGPFNFNLTGLAPGTTYYFRVKADGGIHGTSFGAERSVMTSGFSYTVPTATGTGTATFSSDLGNITGLTAIAEGTLPTAGKPAGVIFPNGLFSFNITGIAPGSTVTVTITLPSAIPAGAQYWKYQNGLWIDCTSLLGDDDGDNVLTLTLTDGGLGDGDGIANGTIVDPGGPATPVGAATPTPSTPRASPSPPAPPQLPPADIRLHNISVSPGQARAGQPVTVLANVVNNGASAGSYNVALNINGKVEQQRIVEVSPGAAYPVKFTVTKSEPGTYKVAIDGQRTSFAVIGSDASGTPADGGLIALLIMGILVIVVAVLLILDLRRPTH
jgi:hypothetical protein